MLDLTRCDDPEYTQKYFYPSSQWRALRLRHLESHPVCVDCEEEGIPVRIGDKFQELHVDHIISMKIAPLRALDPTNLATRCKYHHSKKTWQEVRPTKKKTEWIPLNQHKYRWK